MMKYKEPKFNVEYVEAVGRVFFQKLSVSWPRKTIGGRSTPHINVVAKLPKFETKILYGVLREIVPDDLNTLIRRDIMMGAINPINTPIIVSEDLLKFIGRFEFKEFNASGHTADQLKTRVKLNQNASATMQVFNLANYTDAPAGTIVVCRSFDAPDDLIELYLKLYRLVHPDLELPVFNVPREDMRQTILKNRSFKYLAESDETTNVKNPLRAYCMAFKILI